jgi:hypothetical protein
MITHIDKLATQKEEPELINLVFDIIYDWKIEYENMKSHTQEFSSFFSVQSQKKNPHNGDLIENRKWQDWVTYRPTNLYRYFIYEIEEYREINERLELINNNLF